MPRVQLKCAPPDRAEGNDLEAWRFANWDNAIRGGDKWGAPRSLLLLRAGNETNGSWEVVRKFAWSWLQYVQVVVHVEDFGGVFSTSDQVGTLIFCVRRRNHIG